jgi:hypothetical protein
MRGAGLALAGSLLILTACTSVEVRPVSTQEPIKSVLIEENPKVWRSDFVEVLMAGFNRHGIESKVIQPGTPVGNAYVVRYTARQRWDMAMYMSDATIWIYKNDREMAKAVYHLKGGGGLSLMKWQGTATKIDPVIDELLAGVGSGARPAGATSETAQLTSAGLDRSASDASPGPTSLDAMCDMASPVDKAECQGELRFGMTTNEILAKLGRPDEMTADGTMLRYGDRYLSLDEKSRLVAVTDSRPPGK